MREGASMGVLHGVKSYSKSTAARKPDRDSLLNVAFVPRGTQTSEARLRWHPDWILKQPERAFKFNTVRDYH